MLRKATVNQHSYMYLKYCAGALGELTGLEYFSVTHALCSEECCAQWWAGLVLALVDAPEAPTLVSSVAAKQLYVPSLSLSLSPSLSPSISAPPLSPYPSLSPSISFPPLSPSISPPPLSPLS